MAATAQRPKLVVIVGPTASGKSDLAMKVAKKFRGEIICADSRTVYKGMDIGMAKPSPKDRKAVPHWGLDLVKPDQSYNVAQFQSYAERKILEIRKNKNLPIIVGGSGLYVDALLYNYKFGSSDAERDSQNPRHLKKTGKPKDTQIRAGALVVGLQLPKEVLKQRLVERVEKMDSDGLVNEIQIVAGRYGWGCNALNAPGYKAFHEYFEGKMDLKLAKELFVKNDLDLAKRQKTWFKRNRYINWFNSSNQAYKFIEKSL